MKEIWKTITNFEDYQVSNLGNIKSTKFKKSRILKPQLAKDGYYIVRLCNNGECKTLKIHILMGIEFLNHIPDNGDMVVDHKDNIPTNNVLDNLQIITRRENLSKDKNTKYTGVYKLAKQKYRAAITINGVLKHIGLFKTDIEAKNAYEKALQEIVN